MILTDMAVNIFRYWFIE